MEGVLLPGRHAMQCWGLKAGRGVGGDGPPPNLPTQPPHPTQCFSFYKRLALLSETKIQVLANGIYFI